MEGIKGCKIIGQLVLYSPPTVESLFSVEKSRVDYIECSNCGEHHYCDEDITLENVQGYMDTLDGCEDCYEGFYDNPITITEYLNCSVCKDHLEVDEDVARFKYPINEDVPYTELTLSPRLPCCTVCTELVASMFKKAWNMTEEGRQTHDNLFNHERKHGSV